MQKIVSLLLMSIGLLVISGQVFGLKVTVKNETKERIYLESFTARQFRGKEVTITQFDEFDLNNPISPKEGENVKVFDSPDYAYFGTKFVICAMSPDGDAQKIRHFCTGSIYNLFGRQDEKNQKIERFRNQSSAGEYNFLTEVTFGDEYKYPNGNYDEYYYSSLTIVIKDDAQ